MTIGGNVLENNANVVELTSLNRVGVGVPPCLQNLAPFPENVQFAAGGLLSRILDNISTRYRILSPVS